MAILLLFVSGVSMAQYRTGSVQLDGYLRNMAIVASIDFGTFRTRISTVYNLSSGRLERLYAEVGRSPADLFMLLEVARLTRRSPEQIFPIYWHYQRHGWGVIARQAGIKPGSAAFHALKAQADRNSRYMVMMADSRRYARRYQPLPRGDAFRYEHEGYLSQRDTRDREREGRLYERERERELDRNRERRLSERERAKSGKKNGKK